MSSSAHELSTIPFVTPCSNKCAKNIVTYNDLPHMVDNYVILEKLGYGGFGFVCKVMDVNTQIYYAMKIVSSTSSYKRELFMLEKVQQSYFAYDMKRYITTYVNASESGNIRYTIFPLLACTVFDYVKNKKLELPELKRISLQIVKGLHFLHSNGIIHGDIKLENVMLEEVNTSSTSDIKLIDLGLAHSVEENTNHDVSTLNYRAPEMMLDQGFDTSSDIWSVGCALFSLWTGKCLFVGDTEKEVISMISHVIGPAPQEYQSHKIFDEEFLKHSKKLNIRRSRTKSLQDKVFRFRGPYTYETLDEESLFVDLLQRMLVWNPAHRITAEEAMDHMLFHI